MYVYKRTSEQRQRQLSLMLLAFEDIKQKQNERQRHLNSGFKKKSQKGKSIIQIITAENLSL